MTREIAIVLGSDTNGSAVACRLHAGGFDVVLIDRADPPCAYRGMAFSDAWFLGTAELDALSACFCASVRSIPTVLQRRMIAATTWSWRGVATVLGADVLVDTRPVDARFDLRAFFPIGIGDASGNADLCHADVITRLGADLPKRTMIALDRHAVEQPPPCAIVLAQRPGRVATRSDVGDSVAAGEHVASVGLDRIVAPAAGVIRGLPARGARVSSGDVALHIDARGKVAHCFGIEPSAHALAEKVTLAIRDCESVRSARAARDADRDQALP